MELRHLQYFLAVAETQNVTRAADRCFVAQSALSAQIARLEAEVGTPLFVRSRRGMHLTAAGEALRPLANRILNDVAHAKEEMAALRGLLSGRLRLGMIQGLPTDLDLVALVAAFNARHPGVDLHVRTGASAELARDVVDGVLDLSIVALREPDLPAPPLILRPLVDDSLVAVIATAGARRRRAAISVADLLAYGPFIHYRRGSGLRRSVDAAFERAGVSVEVSFELDQFTDMVRLAGLGVGVTIVPASVLQSVSGLPDVSPFRVLPLTDPLALHTVGVVTLNGPSPAAQAFLAMLDEHAAGPIHLDKRSN